MMNCKKITLLAVLFLTLNTAFGQKKVANLTPDKIVKNTYQPSENAQARFMEMDTILSPVLLDTCSGTVANFLSIDNYGYIGGTNGFMDLEKAQRMIANNSNFSVTEVFAFFSTVNIVGDGAISAKIYQVDPLTNGPGTLVGTSEQIKGSDINLDPEFVVPTPFVFSTPAPVIGNEFFVSIDFSAVYTAQDTIGLWLTEVDCGFAEDAWELFSDGQTWASLSNPDISWGLPFNFPMLATLQLDDVSSTQEILGTDGIIRLHDAFPNPASSSITITYDLEVTSSVQLEIYSMDGKILQQQPQGVQTSGQYQVEMSTAQLPEGMYLYGIVTDRGRLMNKFTVGGR